MNGPPIWLDANTIHDEATRLRLTDTVKSRERTLGRPDIRCEESEHGYLDGANEAAH